MTAASRSWRSVSEQPGCLIATGARLGASQRQMVMVMVPLQCGGD